MSSGILFVAQNWTKYFKVLFSTIRQLHVELFRLFRTNNLQNVELQWPLKSVRNGQLAWSVYVNPFFGRLPLQSWSFRTWHLNMGPGRHWLISS